MREDHQPLQELFRFLCDANGCDLLRAGGGDSDGESGGPRSARTSVGGATDLRGRVAPPTRVLEAMNP